MILLPTHKRFQKRNPGLAPHTKFNSPGLLPTHDKPTGLLRLLTPEVMAPTYEFNPINVIFWGRRRWGKSLAMVCISKILAPSFKAAGWKVQSNIKIDFADVCHPMLGTLISQNPFMAENSLIDIDEVTELVPSRRAMSGISVNSLSVMRQIRKLHCEVLCTTQFPTDVDQAMLRQLDLWILCRAVIPHDARWNPVSAQKARLHLWVFDLHGQFSDKGLFSSTRKYFPPPMELTWKKFTLHNIHHAWNDYDTFGMVASEHTSESTRSRVIMRQWDIDKLHELEEKAEQEVLEQSDPGVSETIDRKIKEAESIHHAVPSDSFDEWLERKSEAGRFKLSLREARKIMPGLKTEIELREIVEGKGYKTEKKGYYCYAEKE